MIYEPELHEIGSSIRINSLCKLTGLIESEHKNDHSFTLGDNLLFESVDENYELGIFKTDPTVVNKISMYSESMFYIDSVKQKSSIGKKVVCMYYGYSFDLYHKHPAVFRVVVFNLTELATEYIFWWYISSARIYVFGKLL